MVRNLYLRNGIYVFRKEINGEEVQAVDGLS